MSECKTYIAIYLMSACLFLLPLPASARLASIAGNVNLGYTDYELNKSGSKDETADSFVQKYTINASKTGSLYNRKGGAYKLAVNYVNLQYLTDVNGTEYSPSSSFLGWNGEINFDLPYLYGFDLALFSSKRRRNYFVYQHDVIGDLSSGMVVDLNIMDTKGQGFQFKLGTNGGPYYHLYGTNSKTLYDDGSSFDMSRRGLGLEYGVNWLHYYKDKSDSESYQNRVFVLGNVELPGISGAVASDKTASTGGTGSLSSHLDSSSHRRLWYMLTNWLDVSADFYYSEEETDVEDISTKRMTMAFRGDLDRTSIGTYSVHERVDKDTINSRLLSLPLWVDYSLFPGTTIHFGNGYTQSETKNLVTNSVSKSKSLKDSLILTSIVANRFLLEVGYDLNKSDDSSQEKEGHSVYLDLFSKRKAPFEYAVHYKYDTDREDNTVIINRKTSSYLVGGSVSYSLAKWSSLDLKQTFLTSQSEVGLQSTGYERMTTSFTINNYSLRGSRSYLKITREQNQNDDGYEDLSHITSGSYKDSINNRLMVTVDLKHSTSQRDYKGNKAETTAFSLKNKLDYKLERNLRSLTSLDTSTSTSRDDIDASSLSLGQTLEYSYNRKGFRSRTLVAVAGTATYTKREVGETQNDSTSLSMNVAYYPSRTLTFGMGFSKGGDDINKNFYVVMRYPLMYVGATYRQQLHDLAGTEENLYKIDFTKKF